MKVTREEPEPRQVVLNIELEPPDIEHHLNQVYRRRLINRIQIPGFRKGKAPRSIVEAYMGREAIIREGLDSILIETLNQAIDNESLEPFGEPEMEVLEIDPLSFKATVPLEPLVNLGQFRETRGQPEPVEVTDVEVDDVVKGLQRSSGVWEPRDGKVRFDDMVTLDVDGSIEGNQVANDQGVDFVPRQDSNLPFPGFSIYLEGMSKDETKEFTLTLPEDYQESSIAGKECDFKVKVLEIKELKLPEIDDEFAKSVGDGYDSLEALRADVYKRLLDDAEQREKRSFHERTLQEVIDGAEIEYSPLTEERELTRIIEERNHALQEHRGKVDDYITETNKTEEEVKEELRPEAVNRLKRFLVVRQLGQEEGIEVTDLDVEAEVEEMAGGSGESADSVRQAFSSDSARNAIQNALTTRRVMERLAEIVQGLDSKDAASDPMEPEAEGQTEDQNEGDKLYDA